MISRKQFLTLSSLGVISLLYPSYLFSFVRQPESLTPLTILLKQAADLRKQNKYNQAKQKYLQILLLHPNEIRAYDGLRKLYYSKKNKEWEYILILKAAHLSNPSNLHIKQRLYKEYLNASLSNKKIRILIGFNGRLLEKVKVEYESILANNPNNLNFQNQFTRINKLLEWNADTINPHQNDALKAYRKENFLSFKNRFAELNEGEIENRLNGLLAKPYSKDRQSHIRELYKLLINKKRNNKNFAGALSKAMEYYNTIEKQDPYFLKQIRNLARATKQYDLLISIESQNHALKDTFWSALALFDAHLKKLESQGATQPPSLLSNLLAILEGRLEVPIQIFELNTRKIKFSILTNNLESARLGILSMAKDMQGISNAHSIDRLNILIAKYYVKKGDNDGKNKIIKIVAQPENYIHSTDPVTRAIVQVNYNRNRSKVVHIENLQKLLSIL